MAKGQRKYNKQHMDRAINNLNAPFRHILAILATFVPEIKESEENAEQNETTDIDENELDVEQILADIDRIPEQYYYISIPLKAALDGIEILSDILEDVNSKL